jgi:glucose-6-phosphate isomerase
MLGYEAASTAAALVKAERPVVWIELERLDAETLGGLIFFYEYTTAIVGRLLKINPFDQPGVEQGKRYTYGLMGRDAYSADADEANALFKRVKESTIQA